MIDLLGRLIPPTNHTGEVALSTTIAGNIDKIGIIIDRTDGEPLGGCTLIAHNLVLLPRHCIEGKDVRFLKATFGYADLGSSTTERDSSPFVEVIEEHRSLDYAVVRLRDNLGKKLGYVHMNIDEETMTEPALLHYKNGEGLQVSVHDFVRSNNRATCWTVFHNTDMICSGGGYFDTLGRYGAMHLGSQLIGDSFNLQRYALSLKELKACCPNSIVIRLADGRSCQASSYRAKVPRYNLAPALHRFIIDEEGIETQKELERLLKAKGIDCSRFIRTTEGLISFKRKYKAHNLDYAKINHPDVFKDLKKFAIGQSNLHGETNKYSIIDTVESDHTIPHAVWKKVKNAKLKAFVKGKGTRSGENKMPAVTIAREVHDRTRTTGRVKGHKEFIQKLVDYADKDNNIPKVLEACHWERHKAGFDLKKNKKIVKADIQMHVEVGVITAAEGKAILKSLYKK